MMKKAKKYRTHYQRACIYATLPVTDDTVVHEWHRDFYGGRLSEDERLLFADYHAQQGGGQSAETFFAKQGTDYFFRRGGHEAAGPIRALFEKARQVLKALLGRINRSKRQQVIPLLIQELYNDAIADAGRTVLTCDSSPV